MTDDEYEELMEVVDSNGRYESDNLYVMQTYDGLVREAIAKMAELMVCDTEYRNTLLAQIKASHKQVREIAKNKNGNLGFYELMQYEGSLKGLNYCVPIVEGFFKTSIAEDEKDDVIINLTNVLFLINSKYFELIESWEAIDCED